VEPRLAEVRERHMAMATLLASFQPLLRDLIRFDRSRITFVTAAQNALGVFVPLAVGAATGHLLLGLPLSIGALNAAFSDRPGPYALRAGRMVLVSLVGGMSALIGALAGSTDWLTVALVAVWGVGGGLLVVFGPAAEQIGLTSILLLVVYGGFGLSPEAAALQAPLVLAGGLLQTAFSVVAWPLRHFGPERAALAAVFRRLAAYTRAPHEPDAAPPATDDVTAARTILTGLGSAHSEAAEEFRVLLDEAERIRLELVALDHLRSDLARDGNVVAGGPLDRFWTLVGDLLDVLGEGLRTGKGTSRGADLLTQAELALEEIRKSAEGSWGAGVASAAIAHMDALAGQLRACLEIVDSHSGVHADARESMDRARPSYQLAEALSTLRANLSLRSASFRHALRLAVTLVIATALARHLGVSRAYWVPLTVAIVLKPDFGSTFTRGVLRVLGTLVGLGFATMLVHVFGGNVAARVLLIGLLAFFIRSVGPANFGVSAVAVTALVVFLISFVGASPESIIHYRAIDTLLGGLLSLVAYGIWPTWERSRAPSLLATMLDAYRRYFDLVMETYRDRGAVLAAALDNSRLEARLARSNAEASVGRMRSEPAVSQRDLDLAQGVLANSHRFVQSVMALEASLYAVPRSDSPAALQTLVRDVDVMLEAIAGAIRGSDYRGTESMLIDLRADQSAIAKAVRNGEGGSELLVGATERMTNSLNTMADVVRRSVAPGKDLAGAAESV
jgi:uncharacterized membrane protein YccC